MAIDESQLYRTIGANLRRQRLAAGLTQDALANRVGVLRTSITNIEKGRQKAPVHLLYGLCEALEADIASVLPDSARIRRPSFVSVEVEGEVSMMPPRTAELVRQLRGAEDEP